MRIDIPGILLLALGMGALQTVLERGQEEDWFQSRLIITLTFVAVSGLAAFIWREMTAEHPVVNLRVLKDRSLAAGSLFGGVLGLGLYAIIFLLSLYLQNARGYTATQTGLILMPPALVSMVSFVIAGNLTQKIDSRKLLTFGTLLFLIGTYGLCHLSPDTGAENLFWPLLIRGMSLGFLFIPLTLASLRNLRESDVGVGSGLINLTRQLGGSLGIAVASTTLVKQINVHRSNLVTHVNTCSSAARAWLAFAQNGAAHYGSIMGSAHQSALAQLAHLIEGQCATLAFNDTFVSVFVVFLGALPLILLFERPKSVGAISAAG
jgi:DHA2 family multidrug resistance protein